jgi:hypothetical protein
VRVKLTGALHDAEFSADSAKRWLDVMKMHEGWRQLEDQKGNRFLSFELFCQERRPFGLGYCPDAIDRIIRERREKEAAARAAEAKPLADPGRPKKEEREGNKGSDTTISSGRGSDYLTARIARDRPDILERMKAGEFKSVRAAALEAGIVKRSFQCPVDPEGAARLLRKHLPSAEIKKLRDLL